MTSFTASMFRIFRRFAAGSVLVLLAALAACTSGPASPTPVATPTTAASTSSTPPLPPTAVPDTPITLTLWLPTRFAPAENNPNYQTMQRQLEAFARSEDGVPSRVVIKQDHGPGGLLDLLRTANPVAPSVLPDVIALESTELATAARAGLLKPIGSQLPADLPNDLFPFARNLGTLNGELYGLIYSADLEHLAGNTTTTPLPATWSALLDEPRRYLFAVGNANNDVSDAVVAHYLSAGGTLIDGNGQPVLDEAALQTLLQTYQDAQTKGVLSSNLAQLNNANDVWAAWRGNGNTLANLTASQFLSVEARLPDLQYAALPSLTNAAPPIGRGWAYAVVATDPRRQAAALRLLQYLLTPANAGEWTQAAGTLPGRAAAFTTWDDTAYTGFLRDQLAQAQAAPSAATMAVIGPPLRKAVDDVLGGRASPAEAARTAALAVNPGKQ